MDKEERALVVHTRLLTGSWVSKSTPTPSLSSFGRVDSRAYLEKVFIKGMTAAQIGNEVFFSFDAYEKGPCYSGMMLDLASVDEFAKTWCRNRKLKVDIDEQREEDV